MTLKYPKQIVKHHKDSNTTPKPNVKDIEKNHIIKIINKRNHTNEHSRKYNADQAKNVETLSHNDQTKIIEKQRYYQVAKHVTKFNWCVNEGLNIHTNSSRTNNTLRIV